MVVCFVCDLHLSENKNTLQYDALEFALNNIKLARPDAICYAGDVTCDGNIGVYRDFVARVEELGIPFCYVPGNSDLRSEKTCDEMMRLASPLITKVGENSIFSINDCAMTIDRESLDAIDSARGGDVVFMHHPIENFEPKISERLREWKLSHPDSYIFCGHKHVAKICENEIWLQTLDPDKAIGSAPCITYFDSKTGRLDEAYYFSSIPNDMYRRLGLSLYNVEDEIELAIKNGLSCIELRKSVVDFDRERLVSLINKWREAGGENLSIHLPDVKYVEGEAVADPRLSEYMALAELLSADRFTQHVPKVKVSEVKSDPLALTKLAKAICDHFNKLERDVVIGIENMHMTAKDGEGDDRRFGYIPEECLAFMNVVAENTRHKVGINFDFGHARNNKPYNQTYQISTWFEMVGRHVVGFHLHQVKNVNKALENHLSFTDIYGQFICLASFFRAWCGGIVNKAPVIFEMREEGAYEVTLNLFNKYKNRVVSDIHSHTDYSNCSSDDPRRLVMQAYISGLSLFAISDHRHGIKGRVEEYKRDMRAVAREFSDRIKVLVGIELATLSYKFDPESYKIADGFDFCLIEHIDEGGSSVGRNLFEFVDKFKIPCGIAHTDLFGYCDMYGLDYNEFFGEMAKRGMFWEMNVNHDSTHSFRHHSYVERFKESEEQRRIVRDAGLYISVGFDSHDSREYAGDRVHDMYDYLKCNGIKTVDELFGGFKR